MVDKKLGGAGLRGQSAGETALCTVGKEGAGLTYRGYTIEDLAANAKFEEVAYMLLYGELPTQDVLTAYETRLTGMRDLPEALKKVLEAIPKETHPMDVMRTGCSMLGNLSLRPVLTNSTKPPTDYSPRSRRSSAIGIGLVMMGFESVRIRGKTQLVATS